MKWLKGKQNLAKHVGIVGHADFGEAPRFIYTEI